MFGVTGFRPILWLAVSLGFHEYWLPAVGHQPLKSGWSGCVSHFFDSLAPVLGGQKDITLQELWHKSSVGGSVRDS